MRSTPAGEVFAERHGGIVLGVPGPVYQGDRPLARSVAQGRQRLLVRSELIEVSPLNVGHFSGS